MANRKNTTEGGALPAASRAPAPVMTASRRGLLAASAVLPLAGMAAAQPTRDAELIAACDRYMAARAAWQAIEHDEDPTDRALWDAYMAAEDIVEETPAATPRGLLAKAKVADEVGDEDLAWSVIADLLRLGGRA